MHTHYGTHLQDAKNTKAAWEAASERKRKEEEIVNIKADIARISQPADGLLQEADSIAESAEKSKNPLTLITKSDALRKEGRLKKDYLCTLNKTLSECQKSVGSML